MKNNLYEKILYLISKNNEHQEVKYSDYYEELSSLLLISTNTLISNKKIFKKNSDAYEFALKIFDVDYKEYIIKNRFLLLGKINKHIIDTTNVLLIESYLDKINRFVERELDENSKNYLDNIRKI